MNTNISLTHKPISPGVHGLIDYAFAFSLLAIPVITNTNKKTKNIFTMLAGQVFLYSALTKQPYAIKQVIPFKVHQKIDVVNLAGLALLSTYKGVCKNKAALFANIGLTAIGVMTVLLTDWKQQNDYH